MTEHIITRTKGPDGSIISHVQPEPDLEAELRDELGRDPFGKVAKRAQVDIDKAMKAALMYAPVRGVTVDIGDYDMHTIGSSSR